MNEREEFEALEMKFNLAIARYRVARYKHAMLHVDPKMIQVSAKIVGDIVLELLDAGHLVIPVDFRNTAFTHEGDRKHLAYYKKQLEEK